MFIYTLWKTKRKISLVTAARKNAGTASRPFHISCSFPLYLFSFTFGGTRQCCLFSFNLGYYSGFLCAEESIKQSPASDYDFGTTALSLGIILYSNQPSHIWQLNRNNSHGREVRNKAKRIRRERKHLPLHSGAGPLHTPLDSESTVQ